MNNGKKENKEKNSLAYFFSIETPYLKIPLFAVIFGVISIFIALLIGYKSYQYSISKTEKHFYNFYLKRADFLKYIISMNPYMKKDDILLMAELYYKKSVRKPGDEYLCIVDGTSKVILHTADPDSVGNFAGDNTLFSIGKSFKFNLSNLIESESDYVGEYISGSGELQVAAFVFVPDRNWVIGIHRSKEALIKEVRSDYNIFFLGILIICCLIFPIYLGLLFWAFHYSKKKEKIDEARIVNSLREKEILLKEIHHRVKNNMQIISSLISLQLEQIDDEKAYDVLLNSQNRIYSMALIHEKLYQSGDFSHINFGEYINSILIHLYSSFNLDSDKIKIEVNIETVDIDLDKAIPCALIINETVTNCLRHAFAAGESGKIKIEFYKNDEGRYNLIIDDNGKGLPENFNMEDPKSLGFQLIKALALQLRGKFEFYSDNGTKMVFTFPL